MLNSSWRRWSCVAAWSLSSLMAIAPRAHAQVSDIVLYASDVSTIQGNWTRGSATGAAGGQQMASADRGWSAANAPLASPTDYFEATFSAPSATTYKIWMRLRASGNSKWNDAVWVQFSDSTTAGGGAVYRRGTTSALLVNLEPCNDCGVNGWGWQDNGYWMTQTSNIRFSSSGSHTIRVQTREDGVQIDQIVLSPSTYTTNAPGQGSGDGTIVPKPATSSGSTPYSGSPVSLPGTIHAENFDNGGAGVGFSDTSAGNYGGAYRTTDVDLESSSGGGYNVGWASGGEWLKYAVNVASAGSYTVTFRIASGGGGGTFHLEMNGSNVTGSMSVPNTGGWQNWQTLSRTVTLAAGAQTARLVIDTTGGNFDTIVFASASGGSLPATPNTPNVPTGTVGVSLTPTLSWQASGATSYELRLGTSNPPPVQAASITNAWYSGVQLAQSFRYYWQVVARNSAGSTTGPVWSFTTEAWPPPPPPTGGQLRMMTWNIHQGRTRSNVYDLVAQANYIASHHPDVVALQEVQTWDENQPQRLRTLLQNATGVSWTVVWAPVTNAAGTEGNVILTRLPVVSSSTFQMHATTDYSVLLANRSAARAAVQVGGTTVNVFSTHLEYANTSWRTTQLAQLMGWLPGFAGPRLIGGDFNSWWGESWINTMRTQHTDTWEDVTGSNQNGYTVNGAVRFDYIFRALSGASRATPTNCFVPSTSLSDHNPVIADFTVQ